MPGTSTQIASKARIVADLQAVIGLPVVVTWGAPNWDPNKMHDRVAVTDIDNALQWANLGQRQRQEDYVVKVEVDVFRNGTDCQGAEMAADALLRAVDAAVIADYTLGGTVTWAVVDRTTLASVEEDAGYHTHGEAHIAVQNRI